MPRHQVKTVLRWPLYPTTLFKIINKVIEVLYRLDLLLKIKIYLVYYIAILEPVYKNYKLLVYKQDTYKGYKEDEQLIKKILQYNKVDS